MLLVPRKLQARPWSWSGLVMVALATPAIVLAALVAGLFALLVSPLVLASTRQGRAPWVALRAVPARDAYIESAARAPDQNLA